ncbi:MAG: Maf family protein [Bifidobacteriaceae bacterium]|jgi:septum formation protein|nr:Maf family protein [Bifidobacteriaceae bacterium]
MNKVILASASQGRFNTLKNAGITPSILTPNLNESLLIEKAENSIKRKLKTREQVLLLAHAKGIAAIKQLKDNKSSILIAGDSLFEFEGEVFGKPENIKIAKSRIKQMTGKTGTLYSGLFVYNIKSKKSKTVLSSAKVTLGVLDDEEIDSYLATGESLKVAGGFTVDALGGPYIDAISGDYHTVIGLPLPKLRYTLKELGVKWSSILDDIVLR